MKEKFSASLIFKLFNIIFEGISFYLLFLKLDPDLFGIWALLISIMNLSFMFMRIGFNIIHFQYSGAEKSSVHFPTFFLIKCGMLILSIITTMVMTTVFQLWNSDFILFLFFSYIFFFFSHIFVTNFNSKLQVFKAEIPISIINFGKSISIIFLSLNISAFTNPLLFLSCFRFFFHLVLLLIVLYLSRNEFHHINKIKREYLYKYLRDVRPLVFFFIVSAIATNLGNLILDSFYGHESLAYYDFINKYFIQLLILFSALLNQLFILIFSWYFKMNKLSTLKQIVYLLEKYFSIFYLSIAIIIYLNAGLILSIFLPNYKGSTLIIYILILLPFIIGISRPYEFILTSGKKQQISYGLLAFINVLIILMMIFLIPPSISIFQMLGLGVIGYALAQTIPWILMMILARYFCFKYFAIKPNKNIILHFCLALISLFVTMIVKINILNIILKNQILLLITSSLIVLGLFLILLFVFKELKKKDIKFFIELFSLKRYVKSIKDEFNEDGSFI